MLWEVEICPAVQEIDREAIRVINEAQALGALTVTHVRSARAFLLHEIARALCLVRSHASDHTSFAACVRWARVSA